MIEAPIFGSTVELAVLSGTPLGFILETVDLTGDGRLDLLIGGAFGSSQPNMPVQITALANGGGTSFVPVTGLANGTVLPAMFAPISIDGDFNGDGRNDVALVDVSFKDFSLSPGDPGFNAFIAQPAFGLISGPTGSQVAPLLDGVIHAKDLAVGDIDGDGDNDIFANASGGFPNEFDLALINNGTGQFTKEPARTADFFNNNPIGDLGIIGVDLVEATGDGHVDIVLGQEREQSNLSNSQSFLLVNDGDGNFSAADAVALPIPDFNNGFAIAQQIAQMDFNNDGLQDLLLVHSRQILAGQFGQEPNPELDGTGRFIQALVNQGGGNFVDESFARFGDQANTTSPLTQDGFLNINRPFSGTDFLVDINRDGFDDIVIQTSQPDAATNPILYLNDGAGRFEALDVQDLFVNANQGSVIGGVLSDLNGDGFLDLVSVLPDNGPDQIIGSQDDSTIVIARMGVAALSTGPNGANPAFLGAPGFNELFYLNENPDVAAALETGAFSSGLEHFLQFGRDQGLAPMAPGAQFAGTDGADFLIAVTGDEVMMGLGGTDVLFGGLGDDLVMGGPGQDTAVFSGGRASYQASIAGGVIHVEGPDGSDRLSEVELFQFDDGTFSPADLIDIDPVPNAVYRFFNPVNTTHFYTASAEEADAVLDAALNGDLSFVFEGPSFKGVSESDMGADPVFRFFNTLSGVHFYTISQEERDAILAAAPEFVLEGVAYFAHATETPGTTPLFRFFNSDTGTHFYTPSAEERDAILDALPGFIFEGSAYFVEGIA
ncbi:MAG: FG-GAP-like repeat-containing protein [Pseudomonadota bacterium]